MNFGLLFANSRLMRLERASQPKYPHPAHENLPLQNSPLCQQLQEFFHGFCFLVMKRIACPFGQMHQFQRPLFTPAAETAVRVVSI